MIHLLWLIAGLSGHGAWYNFWSGIAGDIGIAGGGFAIYRKHNCHVHGCWRLGRHPVEGTEYTVCRKHHPEDAPTVERIHAAHRAAQKRGINI